MISEYKTTNSELAILGLIAEKPVHGYEVEQIVEQRGMRQWTDIGFSSIYHILNKLEKNGLLRDEIQAAGARPARRIFHLTSLGKDVLLNEIHRRLSSPRVHSSDMDLVLANWMLFPQDVIITGLREQRQYLAQRLEQVRAQWENDLRESNFPLPINELFDHTCHALKTEIEWLDACLHRHTNQNGQPDHS
jgi:DNA-binding PadR family transcriptional regulator